MKTKFNVGDIVYYIHGQKIVEDKIESFIMIGDELIYKVKSNKWSFVEKQDKFNRKVIFKNIKELKKFLENNIYSCL